MNKKTVFIMAAAGTIILVIIGVKFFLLEKSVSQTLVQNNIAGRQTENNAPQEEALPEETTSVEPPSQEQEKTEEIAAETLGEKIQPSETKNGKEETKEDEDGDEEDEKENDFSIKSNLVSFGYEKYGGTRKIDTIIVHSTYCVGSSDPFDLDCALSQFKDYGVSSHYIIDRDGDIYQLVKENNIAYHAGTSQVPDGRKNVNDFSIGIEVVNSENSKPTSEQYQSLKNLIKNIKQKYSIKYVLGHKDIAPGRKTDPWNFDWGKIK